MQRHIFIPLVVCLFLSSCWTDNPTQPAKTVEVNGIQIAYRTFGTIENEPLLFIQGVGGEMPIHPDGFLQMLADEGHGIIVFDNRDIGASTHLDSAGLPAMEEIEEALQNNQPPPLTYFAQDMANDALGVLNDLQVEKANFVGGSGGGMIAQIIAAEEPGRVASLTLISSSNNNPELPASDLGEGMENIPDNQMRQGLAFAFSGDLRSIDTVITAPTVVIHGDKDKAFPVEHGRDLAASIPYAELVIIEGMGHVPEGMHDREIFEAIQSVMARADEGEE